MSGMNLQFLREKILAKFGRIEDFADNVGVSRVAVSNWLHEKTVPEESRFLDIVNSLDLTAPEIDRLLGIPETQIVFRRTGLEASSAEVQRKSRDLAETF